MTSTSVGSFTPSVLLELTAATGRLAKYGLDVVEEPVTSSPAQFRSLISGELQVALTSPDNVLAYRFSPTNPLGQVADVRIVAAIDRGLGLGLYTRPGGGVSGLSGASVAVDVPNSGFAFALYELAASLGVEREHLEIVTLGSTPRRLEALLAGECDATMLNAGNELIAESAGCERLAGVEALGPYLGTVIAVSGPAHLPEAQALGDALLETAEELLSGELDGLAVTCATRRLGLDSELAQRFVARMRSPTDGLVPSGLVDRASLETLVRLRTTYSPNPTPTGEDALTAALQDGSGLVHQP